MTPAPCKNRTDFLQHISFLSRCQARLCSRMKGPTAPIPSKERRFIPGMNHRGFPARLSVTVLRISSCAEKERRESPGCITGAFPLVFCNVLRNSAVFRSEEIHRGLPGVSPRRKSMQNSRGRPHISGASRSTAARAAATASPSRLAFPGSRCGCRSAPITRPRSIRRPRAAPSAAPAPPGQRVTAAPDVLLLL
jgi:hypothetical protein